MSPMELDTWLSVCLGLGLAAACGFRVFVPLLAVSVASQAGYLQLTESFAWLGGTPALVALGVATALEIGAYYVPWLDNALDTVAGPAAVVAGVITTASVVTGLDPLLRWTLAVIAGGGAAGSIQALTTGLRGASTLGTAGFGNFLVSTLELVAATALVALALALPLVAFMALVALGFFVARRLLRGPATPAAT